MILKIKGVTSIWRNPFIIGGAEGDRTPDLMNAIHARSQLRHSPNYILFKFIVKETPFWTRIHPVRCLLSNRVNTDYQDKLKRK